MNTLITHTRTKGDLRTPLGIKCLQGDKPLDWSEGTKTAAFFMVDDNGNAKVSSSSTGVTVHPTFEFTVDATTNRILCNDHVVQEGDQVVVSSDDTLPGGLAEDTRYFAVQVTPNAFKLSDVPNGSPIDITSAGSGEHTFYVVGHVQKEFDAADVNTAGDYWAWFTCTEDGETDTFPADGRRLKVVIKEAD